MTCPGFVVLYHSSPHFAFGRSELIFFSAVSYCTGAAFCVTCSLYWRWTVADRGCSYVTHGVTRKQRFVMIRNLGIESSCQVLRSIFNAPWYVPSTILHTDLQISAVKAEITNFSTKYREKLITHPSELIPTLLEEEGPRRLTFKNRASYI
jgi:hypothetical protein